MKGSVRTKDPAAQRQTRAVPMIKLTGRKTIGTAEKALRESETKFRDLAEKSLVGIYLIQDDIFKYVNPRFAEIYDYTVEEIVDKLAPGHLVSAEDRDLVLENIRKRIEGETKSFHYEFRSVTKTGRNITVEVYGSGTIYEGKPALIGTLLDITARKRNEELLRQAEEKYRGIFENAVEGIFQSTPKGQFVVVNPALAKMMGYGSPDQLVAALTDIRYQLYVEPARRSEFMAVLEREGIIRGFECQLRRRDGRTIWVSMNARTVRGPGGETLYYEGTVEDITEKKHAEQELRKLNALNKTIIDNAPIAIFTLDREGRIVSVNPGLASLTGLGDKIVERLMGFDWLRNPFTVNSGLAAHIRRGLAGEAFQVWDFPFVNYKGDKSVYIDFRGVPLKGKDGTVEGLLCMIEDTTDRVKTRARLMQEVKLSFIGRLAAGVAHELNNPLAMVVAYAELAGRHLKSLYESGRTLPELDELRRYLDIVEEEAFRCKIAVDDLLSLPRKEGSEATEVDINTLLSNLLERIHVTRSNVRIVKELNSALPPIVADATAVRQAFASLVANAMDAVEGRAEPTVVVRSKLEQDCIEVQVEDNGVGIPTTIVEKIFEPFFTTKESKKGVGLGLSLCRDLLSNMGGTIRVESRPGHGTTFYVTLPLRYRGI